MTTPNNKSDSCDCNLLTEVKSDSVESCKMLEPSCQASESVVSNTVTPKNEMSNSCRLSNPQKHN